MRKYLKIFRSTLAYQGELILRGEAVIGYKDFEQINEEIRRSGCKIQKSAESVQRFRPPAEQ